MATGGWDTSVRVYEEDDKVDEKLLNQLSKWILYNRLPWLARNLGFTQAEISRIMVPFNTPEEQIFQILYRWHNRNYPCVRDLVESLINWQSSGCLDAEVWKKFLQDRLNPALMPAQSDVQPPAYNEPMYCLDYNSQEVNVDNNQGTRCYIVELPDEPEVEPEVIPTAPPVDENVAESTILDSEMLDLQQRLHDSLNRTWKNSLSHDWIPVEKAKTFPLREFYVGLRWVRVVKRAIQNFQRELASIYDIFDIVDRNQKPKATNILVTAGPGMGKTCSMAKLALDWKPGKADDNNPVNMFNFIFLLRLRYANNKSSSVELIIKQHGKLEATDSEIIESIIKGKTNHRVLLLLDGYDEYKPGTNKNIDRAIEHSIGNSFLILTSRPGRPSDDEHFLRKEIRDKMDGEVTIEGFSDENIKLCSTRYLDSKENSDQMLKQAQDAGVSALLKIPIILLMVCVVFSENKSLPETRTGIYKKIFKLTIDRTALKTFPPGMYEKEFLDSLLCALGELSWRALQSDVQQLLLEKKDVQRVSPVLLKLGLLFETGFDEAAESEQETFLSFQHKSLQEYSSSYYVKQRLQASENMQETLLELFPSWVAVKKYEEVILFFCGLMVDPMPLVNHTYEMFIKSELNRRRSGDYHQTVEHQLKTMGKDVRDLGLFRLLFKEIKQETRKTMFHNEHLNLYNHGYDDYSQQPRDTSPIHVPSKLFEFLSMREGVESNMENILEQRNVDRKCAVRVIEPVQSLSKRLMSICKKISRYQQLTDLWLEKVICKDITSADVPIIDKEVRSLVIHGCFLPSGVIGEMLTQLVSCKKVTHLGLSANRIGDNSLLLSDLIRSWGSHPKLERLYLSDCQIPKYACGKILESLSTCSKITHLYLAGNFLEDHGHKLTETIRKWEDHPLLQKLSLRNCYLAMNVCKGLLESLAKCHNLKHLNLSNNRLGEKAQYLCKSIEYWTDLQSISLENCSIPTHVCNMLLTSLSSRTKLTYLRMSGNSLTGCLLNFLPVVSNLPLEQLTVSEAGLNEKDLMHLSLLIQKGKLPELNQLALNRNNFSAAEVGLQELLRNCITFHQRQLEVHLMFCNITDELKMTLSTFCKDTNVKLNLNPVNVVPKHCEEPKRHLTHVGGKFRESPVKTEISISNETVSQDMVECIRESLEAFHLQVLKLKECEMESNVCRFIMHSLSMWPTLTVLDLSGTRLGANAKSLADTLQPWNKLSLLMEFILNDCKISKEVWEPIFVALSSRKKITHLDFSNNTIGSQGKHLVRSIEAWGAQPALKVLYLTNCALPQEVSGLLLKSIACCDKMTKLWLSGNTIDGSLPSLLSEKHQKLNFLFWKNYFLMIQS